MSTMHTVLQPDFLVIECSSRWGAYSYILTSCTDRQKTEDVCAAASASLEENEGQNIEFTVQTLKELVGDSGILDEIVDGDSDGFDNADPDQLTIERIFQPGNLLLLHEIVDQLFETGYENGIIAEYIECDEVTVLKSSE